MLSAIETVAGRPWRVYQGGHAAGPALLLLHGFTGSGLNWQDFAGKLAGWRVIAPDLPGHGETAPPTGPMPAVARDLVALLDRLGVDQAVVLGYSMGGRLALHLALEAPERVRALVLVGATPGLADAEARRRRVSEDAERARRLEADYPAFVADWENLPLFATQRALAAETRERIDAIRRSHDPAALAAALRFLGTGSQDPLHERLSSLTMPILWVVGEYDAKFRAIADAVRPLLPQAQFTVLPYAGHAAHLERPSAFRIRFAAFAETLPAPDASTQGARP